MRASGFSSLLLRAASNASSASIVSALARVPSFIPTVYIVMAVSLVQATTVAQAPCPWNNGGSPDPQSRWANRAAAQRGWARESGSKLLNSRPPAYRAAAQAVATCQVKRRFRGGFLAVFNCAMDRYGLGHRRRGSHDFRTDRHTYHRRYWRHLFLGYRQIRP